MSDPYKGCCDYCLRELGNGVHCSGNDKYHGCHEHFATRELYDLHFHKLTRGCKFPGNLPYFFEREGTWYKNHLAEERDKQRQQQENTHAPSANSRRTQNVGKHSTSKGSKERTYRADRPLGPS